MVSLFFFFLKQIYTLSHRHRDMIFSCEVDYHAITLRLRGILLVNEYSLTPTRMYSHSYVMLNSNTYHVSKCTRATQTLLYSNYKHLLNLLIRLQVKDSGAVFSSHLRSQIVASFFGNFKFGTDSKRPSRFACFNFTIFFSRGCFSSFSDNVRLIGRTASDFVITLSF